MVGFSGVEGDRHKAVTHNETAMISEGGESDPPQTGRHKRLSTTPASFHETQPIRIGLTCAPPAKSEVLQLRLRHEGMGSVVHIPSRIIKTLRCTADTCNR